MVNHTIMRRLFGILFCLLLCAPMWAQKQVVVYREGRSPLRINLLQVDSIRIEDAVVEEHEAVDLGLSVQWATCNIGAELPESYGNYYAWGEVKTKAIYTENNYKHMKDGQFVPLGQNIAGTTYDVARQQWGGDWRLPTVAEVEELAQRCVWTWTSQNGVNGYLITGPSGDNIFLPAAGQKRSEALNVGSTGYYWTATPASDYPSAAYNLNFSGYAGRWSANRSYGFTVRAVR